MTRLVRWLVALALLPICIGASKAALLCLRGSAAAPEFWIAFGGGVGAWLLVFLALPKPVWLYVVGHELTHALWGILFGAKVKSLRATAKGGQVVLSHSNTLIALAPYFFPFYTAIFTGFALTVRWLWPSSWVDPVFHFGLGITYAFHVTLTLWILRIRQSDITGEGYLLSAMIIWLGNVLMVLTAVPPLTGTGYPFPHLYQAFLETGRSVEFTGRAAMALIHRLDAMRAGWR